MTPTKAPAPDFAEAVGAFEDAVRLHERRRAGGEERKEMNAARSSLLAQYEEGRERMRQAFEAIERRICTWRDIQPEKTCDGPPDESWESWFHAAFDLLALDVKEIIRSTLNQAPETGR